MVNRVQKPDVAEDVTLKAVEEEQERLVPHGHRSGARDQPAWTQIHVTYTLRRFSSEKTKHIRLSPSS